MALDCPRCLSVKLDEIEIANVILDRCRRCAGLWFDSAEIETLVGRGSNSGPADAVLPPLESEEEALSCPRCRDVRLRRLVIEVNGEGKQYLFRCVSCLGTWLDRGELADLEDRRLAEVLRAYFGASGQDVRD